jgi:transposase-like protein
MIDNQEKCIVFLEQIRWSGRPKCPYCNSVNASKIKQEWRYHCNNCFTSYSVTVGTLFHQTHVKLPKWFQAIELVVQKSPNISARKLAVVVGVNKNTAAYMINRIKKAVEVEDEPFLKLILQKTLE